MGFGTYQLEKDEKSAQYLSDLIVNHELRLIDTASFYGTEPVVGQAIKLTIQKGIKREDLFIITKLWINDKWDPEAALKKSLKELQLNYIDCYLIHWPISAKKIEKLQYELDFVPLHETWKKLEILVDQKLTKSIGVSNFNC